MLFPDLSPSREECIAAIAEALQSDTGLLYLDASVLIHCYEMSALASDDLLRTLDRYGERVGVPVWAARETWDYLTTRTNRRPLMALAERIQKDLARFQTETTRYIDDIPGGMTRDDYQRELAAAVEALVALIRQVAHHEPKIDQTSQKLLPFVEAHRLASNLAAILTEVSATAASRMTHRVPPGFGDAPNVRSDENEDATATPPKAKGKAANPHGDLIIWLEILADCATKNAEHLIIVTRDTRKGDWAYAPRKVRDDKGRPQENRSGVTLPHPLLVHEALQRVPTLKSLHVVSVDMLANIWTSQRFDISNLAAALQAEEEASDEAAAAEAPASAVQTDNTSYVAEFGSADMAYEPDPQNELDQLISDLSVEDWKVQNQTARRLESQLGALERAQRLQVGRGLVFAANNGALEPAELLERVLGPTSLPRPLRSDLLIGALAEIYLAETGEPRKPVATRGLAAAVYRHDQDGELREAYDVVLGRLRPLRREYLALPREEKTEVRLELAQQAGRLINVATEHAALLEEDAPAGRALQRSGRETSMTVAEIIELIAEEFVLPIDRLAPDLSPTASLVVPESLGFIAWGPRSGIHLR